MPNYEFRPQQEHHPSYGGSGGYGSRPEPAAEQTDIARSFPTASRHGSGDALAQETVQEQACNLSGTTRKKGKALATVVLRVPAGSPMVAARR